VKKINTTTRKKHPTQRSLGALIPRNPVQGAINPLPHPTKQDSILFTHPLHTYKYKPNEKNLISVAPVAFYLNLSPQAHHPIEQNISQSPKTKARNNQHSSDFTDLNIAYILSWDTIINKISWM